MAETQIENITTIDPETEFLASKRRNGNEWETFKENVRPLKRGRNVNLLNHALHSHTDNELKKSLIEQRRKLIEAIEEYQGDDPLLPWIQCIKWVQEAFPPGGEQIWKFQSREILKFRFLKCIKWVQEAFPPGGDSSGLVVIYEQCVRAFWHSERYKNDLRYLKVWLEYADNCFDADVIYAFLDANGIGKTHSIFYISYALHLESKKKFKAANQMLELGISRNAQPVDKLKAAYRQFFARSMARPISIDDSVEKLAPTRSFGTVLAKGENRAPLSILNSNCDPCAKNDRTRAAPLSIYKDPADTGDTDPHKPDLSHSWHTLGARADRNKENNAIPGKWKSYKIPQRPGTRTGGATPSSFIPVFVDEECQDSQSKKAEGCKSSSLKIRQEDDKELKRETELLRKNPLRNFPQNSLPR